MAASTNLDRPPGPRVNYVLAIIAQTLGKNANEIVKGLFGSGGSESQGGEQSGDKPAKGLLDQLFKP